MSGKKNSEAPTLAWMFSEVGAPRLPGDRGGGLLRSRRLGAGGALGLLGLES